MIGEQLHGLNLMPLPQQCERPRLQKRRRAEGLDLDLDDLRAHVGVGSPSRVGEIGDKIVQPPGRLERKVRLVRGGGEVRLVRGGGEGGGKASGWGQG